MFNRSKVKELNKIISRKNNVILTISNANIELEYELGRAHATIERYKLIEKQRTQSEKPKEELKDEEIGFMAGLLIVGLCAAILGHQKEKKQKSKKDKG